VRIAPARGDESGHRSARYGAAGLHEHLEFKAVGETPHELAYVVTGKRLEARCRAGFSVGFHSR
jgi:hypothetical protein